MARVRDYPLLQDLPIPGNVLKSGLAISDRCMDFRICIPGAFSLIKHWKNLGVLEPIYLYATWPDAVYACINKKEACAPEEIRKKSICVEADIGAVLEKLYDRKNSQGDVAVPEEIC